MRIEELSFRNFRNYEKFELHDLGQLVILCGPNAVGKTNVLEGIHLLTAATSFRHPQISQLIRRGSNSARIASRMGDGNRQVSTVLSLEPGKKRFAVNGKAKQTVDVRGVLPAVSFVPDDLDLAKRASSVKRDAIDALGAQLNRNYAVVLRDFERALRYKNRLLKDEEPQPMVDAINETLVTVASQLYCYRRALFDRLVPFVNASYSQLSQSGEAFTATYLPSWLRTSERYPGRAAFPDHSREAVSRDEVRSFMYDALEAFGPEEARAHRSFVGPHNDSIVFMLDGADASDYASQGQQRSIVLAWKLAEVELVRQTMGIYPVLLLDDVMSELDETRRAHLVGRMPAHIQTFITTTDLSPFDSSLIERAQVVNLPL